MYKINDKIIVLPPVGTDLDGYACAVGYSEFLREQGYSSLPWISGNIDAETKYVVSCIKAPIFEEDNNINNKNKYVYVDGSNLQLFPKSILPALVTEVIDHHFPHDIQNDFPNSVGDIQRVGAAATLVIERFQEKSIKPKNSTAILLYCAIYSNTQGLSGSVTTQRDHDAVAWLNSISNIPKDIVKSQFNARREDILINLSDSIKRESKNYFNQASKEYFVAQLELPDASAVVEQSKDELFKSISALADYSILNMVDITKNESTIIIPNDIFRKEVEQLTNISFQGNFAVISPIILRKQIVAAIAGNKW